MKPFIAPVEHTPDTARPAHAWHLVLGLAVWLVWFCATYGGLAVACAVWSPPAEQGPLTWLNAGVLLLACVTTAAFVAGAWANARVARRLPPDGTATRRRFIARAAAALYTTAAVSTAVVALPALLLPPCA
ncbi:MAG: hypothetical protein Q7U99_26320 [Rubrivivax sp.]|nr:hypothetical protein [Rubrivivax sp.]MDP3224012.1 hypothetical protein [Rubrivivax sp.]